MHKILRPRSTRSWRSAAYRPQRGSNHSVDALPPRPFRPDMMITYHKSACGCDKAKCESGLLHVEADGYNTVYAIEIQL